MPRYYFHFWDGTLIEDDGGETCAGREEAHAHAKRIALELSDGGGERVGALIFVTEGKSGERLFEVLLPTSKALN